MLLVQPALLVLTVSVYVFALFSPGDPGWLTLATGDGLEQPVDQQQSESSHTGLTYCPTYCGSPCLFLLKQERE